MGILKGPVIFEKLKLYILKTGSKFRGSPQQGLVFILCVLASRERHFES